MSSMVLAKDRKVKWIDVRCPHCGAEAGIPCPKSVHGARKRTATNANMKARHGR